MLHNSKYYAKSIKTNKVKSKNIVSLFKKNEANIRGNNVVDISTSIVNEEVYMDHMDNNNALETSVQSQSTTNVVESENIEPPLKKQASGSDLRKTLTESYKSLFPDFFYSV